MIIFTFKNRRPAEVVRVELINNHPRLDAYIELMSISHNDDSNIYAVAVDEATYSKMSTVKKAAVMAFCDGVDAMWRAY